MEEATWEREDTMRTSYPFLFEDEGTFFNHLVAFNDCCICMRLHMVACKNFGMKFF